MRLFPAIVCIFLLVAFKTTGQIIHIPADYPTIQEGIYAASAGDTVLVAPGTFFENISLNGTNITLASHFLVTNDTSYITSTIINGGQAGSVITISQGEDSTTLISGLSITNGGGVYSGGGIYVLHSSPSLDHLNIYENLAASGGGLALLYSNSAIDHTRIIKNTSVQIGNWYSEGGGGVYINYFNGNILIKNSIIANNSAINDGGGIICLSPGLFLENVDIIENSAFYGGGVLSEGNTLTMDPVNRCNIHSNRAIIGNDLYASYGSNLHIIVDTFSVFDPTNFHVNDTSRFDFDILHAKLTQVDADLYISPGGDDSNTGLSPDDPLKTIHSAMSKMLPFSGDTNTIYLANGNYSPEATGEFFPVCPPDYTRLKGADANNTTLDAQSTGSVIRITEHSFNEVSDLTLTGGQSEEGGGIYCYKSDAMLHDLNIIGNHGGNGAGIFMSWSEPTVRHCLIRDNFATGNGGGLFMETDSWEWDNPQLIDLMIRENHANTGGGIGMDSYIMPVFSGITVCYNTAVYGGGIKGGDYTFDPENRCNIYMNTAGTGSDLYGLHWDTIIVDTFSVMNPTVFHASPLEHYTFDILNGKLEQVEADLYVSPDGDNANSGLTADDPLKTINRALSIIIATETNQRQIHLLDGTYSPGINGEFFPLSLMDYIHLSGTADSLVILDADSSSRVMQIIGNDTNHVSDLTLTGGMDEIGGGLFIQNSDPVLERLNISDNSTNSLNGGGIYSENSNAIMNGLKITGNHAHGSGGGIYLKNSCPLINNPTISNNTAGGYGGGLWVDNHEPLIALKQAIIRENQASNGAGVFNAGYLKLIDCQVSGNTGSGNGGGVYSSDSIWISNSEVRGNAASYGGGLYVQENSFARLDTLDVSGNTVSQEGGGMCCNSDSYTELFQVSLMNNISEYKGGGIACFSEIYLHGTTIAYNHADESGGGIYGMTQETTHFDSTNRCNIYLNSAELGNDLLSTDGPVNIVVDTFTVMYPTDYHAELKNNFTFDILAGKIDQAEADLYVSATGDDANTGLTPDDPLKTVDRAFLKLRSDSIHQHTVHLANGIYSPSTNGEKFPLNLPNYSSLSGESQALTVLDAEETNEVLRLFYDTLPIIQNVTLTRGNSIAGGIESFGSKASLFNMKIADNIGGGIRSYSSNLKFNHIIVENNTAEAGGGIYADYSKLEMNDVELRHNIAIDGGGVYLEFYCDSVLMNGMKFIGNSATGLGGGIYASGCNGINITNTVIDSNTATKGGGLWTESTSFAVKNSLFTNNTTSLEYGGAGLIFNHQGYGMREVTFCNTTFANNSNPGIYFYSGAVNLVNNIFWGNPGPYQIFYIVTVSRTDTLTVMNSNIQGGRDGIMLTGPGHINWLSGNINENPQYQLTGDYPYSLEEGSPCIDAGTPDTTGLYLPFNDIIGNTRVWDGDGDGVPIIDMGPYEFGAPLTVPEDRYLNGLNFSETYIYPNPASDHLTIGSSNNLTDRTVTFINSTGQVVCSMVMPAGLEKLVINLDHFRQGLYTVVFSDESGRYAMKKVLVVN